MRTILAITNALSDINRVRILCALTEAQELCVCQIWELLSLAPSTTSKHLSLLAAAGLVMARKEGRWAYYRLTSKAESPEDGAAIVAWVCKRSHEQAVIVSDRAKLKSILSYSPEELCRMQGNGQSCCSPAQSNRAPVKTRKVLTVQSGGRK